MEAISKKIILDNTDEETIFRVFFRSDFELNKAYKSPFRRDEHPSFVLFQPRQSFSGNKILFKDHGLGICGDCFEFVKMLYNVNFEKALKIIYDAIVKNNVKIKNQVQEIIETNQNKLFPKFQKWNFENIKFWDSFCISKKTLEFYDVNPVKEVVIKDKCCLFYSNKNPIYIYSFKDIYKNSGFGFKMYKPYEKREFKFYRDYSSYVTEGFVQAAKNKNSKICIITKSLKDVMVLFEMNLPSIAPPSESTNINEKHLYFLKSKFKHLIIFFDNDETGLLNASKVSKKYNLKFIYIPESENSKDISDYVKLNSLEKGKSLIKNLLL
jgi:hypothetical protein